MGEVNRRIAGGLYERASQREKQEASEFYARLKSKRDGKISMLDFKKGVESSLSNENVFKQLDLDRDGFLDFEDVLLLFYYSVKKEITILRCRGRGCSILIFGTAYSCFECFFNTADPSFALCSDCHATGRFPHEHRLISSSSSSSSSTMLRDQALLIKFSDIISTRRSTSPSKEELQKMWEEAKSQAGPASQDMEGMAYNYFESMGSNNLVDSKKFLSTLTKQQEEFLTPSPDSDPATNYMKNELVMKLRQSKETATRNNPIPTPSTSRPNMQTTTSNVTISPMKVMTTTVEIVSMAFTIASLSGMCTIM